ncbi:MAG: phosphoglycerate kinase [Bacteroidetes bacterium 4572_128]|nr:MAG: phosphoglycerate kinase [Bacteroidetes bacterium 4572_128]
MQLFSDYNFANKRVLLRVDFNLPLNDKFEITDDSRMRVAIPTIKKILKEKGKLILLSHLGRPKRNIFEERFSNKHILEHLSKLLGIKVLFANSCIGKNTSVKVKSLKAGEVILLENVRFHKGEKEGDKNFAKKLSKLAEVYVNDAFGTAHRNHCSTSIVSEFFPKDKMFAYVIENELKNLEMLLEKGERPFTAIIGGAKISSKIEVISSLLERVDNIIVGGGMAFTFIKSIGGSIGNSIFESDKIEIASEILQKAIEKKVKFYLPIDSVNADRFSNSANITYSDINKIKDNCMSLDIGLKSINRFSKIIEKSKTVLWNGPMGVFEMNNFQNGTLQIAKSVAKVKERGGFSLIGGGDSVAAINKYKLQNKISYISSGGGALLEYVKGNELATIKAIRK